ncbi:MAG TPA: hypothetical protein VF519_02340 [Mycobacteriales bacterium]|jgi:hypothetical protein
MRLTLKLETLAELSDDDLAVVLGGQFDFWPTTPIPGCPLELVTRTVTA